MSLSEPCFLCAEVYGNGEDDNPLLNLGEFEELNRVFVCGHFD